MLFFYPSFYYISYYIFIDQSLLFNFMKLFFLCL